MRKICSIALLLLAFSAHAETSDRTVNIAFAAVPVTQATSNEWRTIYFLSIPNVKNGEIIEMYGEGQLRNDTGINVECAQIMELRTWVQVDPVTQQVYSGGTEPISNINDAKINGWDFDSRIHYCRFSKGDVFVAAQDYDHLYLALRARGRSTDAQSGMQLTVNAGQGQLYYIRH